MFEKLLGDEVGSRHLKVTGSAQPPRRLLIFSCGRLMRRVIMSP
jgi:hypothetical protein